MDWFLTLGIGFLIWLFADALSPLLRPLFRAGGRLYSPPHGSVVLALTWAAAIALTVWAFSRGENTPRLAAAAAVLAVPLALVATGTWRDSRRAAVGQPPVEHFVPARLGVLGRIVALIIAVTTGIAAVLLWPPFGWEGLLGWLGCASAAAIGLLASLTAKVPSFVRSGLGGSSPGQVTVPAARDRE